jgi:hypothetical protein
VSLTDPGHELPKRRDEEGDFHEILPEECAECGCVYFVAREDPTLMWEPGAAWDEGCRDRSCHCHQDPVIGARRA